MSADLYLTFVAACVLLIVIPGPNVALIVANSMAHGPRYGLMTVAGTASAMVLQLALVVLGASALLGLLASLFDSLRWLGVVYLLWLGVRTWRSASSDLSGIAAEPRSASAIFALPDALGYVTGSLPPVGTRRSVPANPTVRRGAAIGPEITPLAATCLAEKPAAAVFPQTEEVMMMRPPAVIFFRASRVT